MSEPQPFTTVATRSGEARFRAINRHGRSLIHNARNRQLRLAAGVANGAQLLHTRDGPSFEGRRVVANSSELPNSCQGGAAGDAQ